MNHHQDASLEAISKPLITLEPQATKTHRKGYSPVTGDSTAEGERMRISSLAPLTASVGAFLIGSALTLAAMLNASSRLTVAALLLLLAAIHILVALALKTTLKVVSFDGQCYRITGLFLTDEIAPNDVCLVVEGRGVLWNVIRLHFNRRTRFGYDIAFVPAVSRKDFAACLRGLRNPSCSSPSSMESR